MLLTLNPSVQHEETDKHMNPVARHIALPAVMSVAFFSVALSPVTMLGCRTRGLAALSIALLSGLLSLGAAIKALYGRFKGETDTFWWIISSLVLAIPVVAMIALA